MRTTPRSDAGIYSNILRFVILFHFGYDFFSNVRERERFETNTGGEITKITTVMGAAAVAMMAFAGSAMAEGHETGNPGKGNQGCTLTNDSTYKNPGKMLQYLSDRDGNPKGTVDKYPNSFANVGDLIDQKCGADEPD